MTQGQQQDAWAVRVLDAWRDMPDNQFERIWAMKESGCALYCVPLHGGFPKPRTQGDRLAVAIDTFGELPSAVRAELGPCP